MHLLIVFYHKSGDIKGLATSAVSYTPRLLVQDTTHAFGRECC